MKRNAENRNSSKRWKVNHTQRVVPGRTGSRKIRYDQKANRMRTEKRSQPQRNDCWCNIRKRTSTEKQPGREQKIKNGEIPKEWENPENKSKLAQKDTDADWTKKNGELHFGYKDHVKCDADSKLITNYSVTGASVHDSQRCLIFIGEEDKVLYADSAYSGKPIALVLPESCENQICEKGYRNSPLTSEQKENNRRKSKIRCRIEHIFGFMTGAMHGITIRSIGITRAWFNIGITNLV